MVKKISVMLLSLVVLLMTTAAPARQTDRDEIDSHADIDAAHATVATDRPTAPTNASGWAGATSIIVAAMFLMAAVIGPAVRAEMVEPAPPDHDHGHDDHHADHAHDDHGHGH